jgi:uncharacterized protein (TIGR03067 family)
MAAQPGPAVARSTTRIRIEGDQWMYIREVNGEQRVTTRYTIKLDPSKKPTWLDLHRDNTKTPYLQGIMAIQRDAMVFSYVSNSLSSRKDSERTGRRPVRPRPTAFEAMGETPQMTMTLRRVAKP